MDHGVGRIQEPLAHSESTTSKIAGNPQLDLRSQTLWTLYTTYVASIHKHHPLLELSKLRRMIQQFSDSYSPVECGDHNTELEDGYKSIEYSLSNAVVLLVLALGKICGDREIQPRSKDPEVVDTTSSGSEYFLHAERILVTTGMTVQCVQAMVLAGLFENQRCRFSEGSAWINRACNTLVPLVKQ
jgi:hypothetical protein